MKEGIKPLAINDYKYGAWEKTLAKSGKDGYI
jgi:hypothetical protein